MKYLLAPAVALLPLALAQSAPMPEAFAPGVISSNDEEYRITFTPDGNTLYFARSSSGSWFPFSRKSTIYTSTLKDGKWSEPQVASFSGKYSDIDPFISPDGKRLYFSSIRPLGGKEREDSDLWVVDWGENGWSEPIHLGDVLNSPRDELYSSVDSQGVLYFGAQTESGNWNIYHSKPDEKGGYGPPQALEAVNTSTWEFNPAVSADGKTLVFTALDRQDGFGQGDLYVTTLGQSGWTAPRNLGQPINSGADEFHPSLSPDGRTLYFIRRGSSTNGGDLFSVPLPNP